MTGRSIIRATLAALVAGAFLGAAPGALAGSPKSDNGKNASAISTAANRGHDSKPPAPPAPPAPAPAEAGSGTQGVQGVVQSVAPTLVVVRQLDGTTVSVPYSKKTHFLIGGKPAKVDDVKTGFVLVASWTAGKPATTLRFLRPS